MNTQVVSQAASAAKAPNTPLAADVASGVFAPAAAAGKPATRASVSFTIARNDRQPLTKTFTAGPDGVPKAAASAALAAGSARRKTLTGTAAEITSQLADVLSNLSQHEALILAPPPPGKDEWKVVTKVEAAGRSDVIARTREHFAHKPGAPAIVGLDIDGKDLPHDIYDRLCRTPDNLTGVLASVFPDTQHAARVLRASVSSGIRREGDGKKPDPTGQHRYFVALDGADAGDFASRLADRLMLAGWLWGVVSSSGRILFRTLIDKEASADPARLFYEADAVLAHATLEYAPDARKPDTKSGGFLDTRQLPPLTNAERGDLEQMKATVRDELKGKAQEARERWAADRKKELTAAGVGSDVAAETVAAALEAGALTGDFPLQLDSGETVSAREILRSPAKYHGKTCRDPFEPEQGPNKAVIYTDGRQQLYTHLHGGACYPLRQDPEDFFDPATADDVGDSGWPEPMDAFGDGDPGHLVDLPAGALPDVLDRYARDTAERVGAPPVFVALGAVIVASAAVGGAIRIQPKAWDTKWRERPFLWGLLVENPGGKKSPIMAAVSEPLSELDARRSKEDTPKRQAWEIANRKRKKDAPPLGPAPRIRRSMVDSFTLEAMRDVLADNPRGLFVQADEVTGLIGSLDQYKAGGGSDRADLLKLMDGHQRTFDRVSRSVRVDCWGASVLGGVQPKKLQEMAGGLDPDGLLQRFIPVVGDNVRRPGVDRAPDTAALADYAAMVTGLAEYMPPASFGDPVVKLSPEAQAVRQRFDRRVEALLNAPQMPEAGRGHLSKWQGFFARLLLIFHMVDNWREHGARSSDIQVSAETAERVWRFSSLLLQHAIRFYETVIGLGAGGDAARQAAGIILTAGTPTISRRDLYERNRAKWRPTNRTVPSELFEAMGTLERMGWCRPAERDAHGVKEWAVNPLVYVRFKERAAAEAERRARDYARVQAAVETRRAVLAGTAQ